MTKENIVAQLPEGEAVITKEMAEAAEAAGVITAPNKVGKGGKKKGSLGGATSNQVIGSAVVEKTAEKLPEKTGTKKATVALYSDRNVHWTGVGKLEKGYNIVSKDQAARWLTRNHVREATPEEVASEYGA